MSESTEINSIQDMLYFFQALWGDNYQGYLPVVAKDPEIQRFDQLSIAFASYDQIKEAMSQVLEAAQENDLYFGLGLVGGDDLKGRGKKEDIIAIPGFWLDIDIGKEGHKADNYPASYDEAKALINQFPLTPTITINSGNGLHLYWLFKSPWYFDSDEDRKRAEKMSKSFHAYFIGLAAMQGYKIDNLSSLTSLLRIPGTLNHKSNPPKQVEYDEYNAQCEEFFYRLEDFEQILEDVHTPSKVYYEGADDGRTSDIDEVIRGCRWMKHCKNDSVILTEPEWHYMLTIVARCKNASFYAHMLSKGYQEYSKEETDKKLQHAAESLGPVTCSYINDNFLQKKPTGKMESFCKGCKYQGGITSPIQLGHNYEATVDPADLEPPNEPIYTDWLERFAETNYAVNKKGHLCAVSRKDGSLTSLANYIARPTKEIIIDDGVEQQKYFEIEGVLEGGIPLPPVQIKAEDFAAMDWMIPCWGIRVNMQPNPALKEVLRNAIQNFGKNTSIETIFAHTGWRKIEGKWCYLHSKGCIGADNVKVLADSFLDSYSLPKEDDNPRESLEASLRLLDIAPLEITLPLLAHVYLAPLCEPLKISGCEPNFILWLYGRTGCRKTSIATLFLSHFREYTKSPPATFKDTVNALERKAFHCKDSILLIDDFHPSDSRYDKERLNQIAQYLVRLFGDKIGKGRMKADTSMRKEYPPRGLGLVTGEDLLSGHSSTARCYAVEINKDVTDLQKLTIAQNNYQSLSKAMLGYVKWLQPRIEMLSKGLKNEFSKIRESLLGMNGHGRTIEAVTWLQIGYKLLLEYAKDLGIMDAEEIEQKLEVSLKILIGNAEAQNEGIENETPEEIFIKCYNALLDSGEYYVEAARSASECRLGILKPTSKLLGWYDNENYYLMPELVYSAVSSFLSRQGKVFPVSQRTLFKHLDEAGLIKTEIEQLDNGSTRVQRTIKKTINNNRKRLLCLSKIAMEETLEL